MQQHDRPRGARHGAWRIAFLAAALAASTLGLAHGVAAQDPVAIDMWSWNNEGAYPNVHEDAIVRFEAANPGVTVTRGKSLCGDACGATYFNYTDYITKFKSSLAASEPPCVAQIPWAGEFRDFIDSGGLLPLTDAVTTGFPAFYEPFVAKVSYKDDFWAIPLDVNSLQIAYNKTLFDSLGLSVPKTQSELQNIVDTLSANGTLGIAMGTKDKWSAGDLFFAQVAYTDGTNTKLPAAGAGGVAWDDPAFKQAADNVVDMVAKGVFAPGANSMDAFKGNLDLFASQAAGMMYPVGNFVTAGVTAAVADAFEWDLFPFPPPDGSTLAPRATGGIAEQFVVTQDCPAQEQAIEFLRYLVNDGGGAALVAHDFIPSWDFPAPTDASPLYQNMLNAQATVNTREIYDTKVYAELLNVMQGVMDGTSTGDDLINAMVAAGAQ